MKKKTIIFTADEKGTECGYCGIMSFDHIHPPNTLPKNFIREESTLHCSKCGDMGSCNCFPEVKVAMGISQWRNHGKKYGYWKYFVELAFKKFKCEHTCHFATPDCEECKKDNLKKIL